MFLYVSWSETFAGSFDFIVISRLTVVSRKAKEEAASGTPTDSRLTRVSILQVQELCKSKMP